MMGDVSQSGHSFGAPGVHPDADQLSAFVEHALPVHERNDVLAHLAGCRDCRETVVMALPPAEVFERTAAAVAAVPAAALMAAAPVKVAAPPRRPWFTRWTILLPAAAAVAALGLFVAYVSRAPSREMPEQAQNAGPQAPAPMPKSLQPSAMAPIVTAPTESEAQQSGSGAPSGSGAASEKKSLGAKGLTPSANVGTERSESEADRMAVAAPAPPPAPQAPMQSADQITNQVNGDLKAHALDRAASGEASSSAGGMLPLAGQQQQALQPQRAQQQVQQGESIGAAANAVAQVPAQSAPLPASAPPAATQTVNVASTNSPIETQSADMARESIAPMAIHGAIFHSSLPSRLSALSTAALGSRVLAIDAHNAVFLSTDSGAHWKRIKTRWQGQAVKVNLILAGGSTFSAGSSAEGAIGGNLAGFEARERSPANTGNVSLEGTVTDKTGAVIPRATVVVTNVATRATRTATTDANGLYTVDELVSGSYEMVATAAGFAPLHLAGVTVDASHANVANLALEVGASTETVTVEASGSEVNTGEHAAKKAAAPALQPTAIFEITTDSGERWTSADGKTWKRN
jgi:hypothetical protein